MFTLHKYVGKVCGGSLSESIWSAGQKTIKDCEAKLGEGAKQVMGQTQKRILSCNEVEKMEVTISRFKHFIGKEQIWITRVWKAPETSPDQSSYLREYESYKNNW